MAFSPAKWKKPWGPVKFREVINWLVEEINARSPIPGCGINISEDATGREISTKPEVAGGNPVGGGTSSGTPVDLYGALNGAPAVFHLLQDSPPTALP